ncbi:ferredoxin--NADP reductase [Erythrobacter sp. EC-HK427]|uniref:ferredoxin--NADP reductase n=1 Tax=Erythrobacter sp. EC-HK427 TaxID=2038396 RepID=UPI0012575E28|nr:ferredoxin--NADP reductase [Erythrobacter sp. EC-HK427]VVS97606.1 Ferredoxin--NADP reductase [Erythrobacter sp. EC-HK427]
MAYTMEKVLRVRHWNDGLFSFCITRPPSFRFLSGQFVMLGLMVDGKPLLRAYSIASQHYAEELEFLSIIVPDGPLTSRLQHIQPGDEILLGAKPVGSLVIDAVVPGKHLHLFGTGTGLAPWISLVHDPEVYERFDRVTVQHTVRHVEDRAYFTLLDTHLANDPLVGEMAAEQLVYDWVATRVAKSSHGDPRRITERIRDGSYPLNPETDRVMLCGSMPMITECSKLLDEMGFVEGTLSHPATYVLERAFAG